MHDYISTKNKDFLPEKLEIQANNTLYVYRKRSFERRDASVRIVSLPSFISFRIVFLKITLYWHGMETQFEVPFTEF